MSERILTNEQITEYGHYLCTEERSGSTVKKYCRDVLSFARWLGKEPVTKELTAGWKDYLLSCGYAPATINSMLAAVNGLFRFLGWDECRVKFLKVQRRLFRDASRELTRPEYERLLETAQKRGQNRIALLMETICATGIRVSEVRYITVEAARLGRAEISLKGKIRTILLPGKLCRKLLKYARKMKIVSGEIFLTRNGTSLSSRQIWAELKRLCKYADVKATKVFPHNLRHLFAAIFYRVCKDIVRLADVLGHSSVETTRIYLLSTGTEHADILKKMHLVS